MPAGSSVRIAFNQRASAQIFAPPAVRPPLELRTCEKQAPVNVADLGRTKDFKFSTINCHLLASELECPTA